MAGLEARIERSACDKVLRFLGVANFKWGVDGWPDRGFLIPGGRPFFIEFKAPGCVPDPRQEHRIACLKLWGYEVCVCDDADKAYKIIEDYMIRVGKTKV